MPRIPVYRQQVQASQQGISSGGANVGPGPEAAAAEGRALARLGQGISQLGNAIYKRDLQDDILKRSNDLPELRSLSTDEITKGVKTGNISSKEILNNFDKNVEKYSEGYSTTRGQDEFNAGVKRLRFSIQQSAGMAESRISGEKAEQSYRSKISKYSNIIQKDPNQFEELFGSIEQELSAETEFIKPGIAGRLAQVARSDFVKNKVLGHIMQKDLRSAKAVLNDSKYDDFFNPNERLALANRINNIEDQGIKKVQRIDGLKYKSPHKFLEEKGFGSQPNIDFKGNDDSLHDSLVDVMNWHDEAKGKFGFTDKQLPMFSPSYIEGMERALKEMKPDEMSGFLGRVVVNAPDKVINHLSKQLGDKHPSYGPAMSIAPDDIETSQNIFAGSRIREDANLKAIQSGKPGTAFPSDRKVQGAFDRIIGNSITNPTVKAQMREAVFDHYVKLQSDTGKPMGTLDSSKFEESFEKIFGEKIIVGNRSVLPFRVENKKFITKSEFTSIIDDMTTEDLMATHGDIMRTTNGEDINLDKSRDRLSLVQFGDGKYKVLRDMDVVKGKDGRDFVLDMKSLYKHFKTNKKGFANSLTDRLKSFFGVKEESKPNQEVGAVQ